MKECSTCGGTGSVWDDKKGTLVDCPTCGGSGLVEDDDENGGGDDNGD